MATNTDHKGRGLETMNFCCCKETSAQVLIARIPEYLVKQLMRELYHHFVKRKKRKNTMTFFEIAGIIVVRLREPLFTHGRNDLSWNLCRFAWLTFRYETALRGTASEPMVSE